MAAIDLENAIALHKKNKLDGAFAQYVKILENCPNNIVALNGLSIVCGQTDRITEGIKYASELVAIEERPEHHNTLGNLFKKNKQYNESIQQFKKALRLNSNYVVAMNNMASAHMLQGEIELAESQLNTALEIKPRYHDARFNYGCCLLRKGATKQALSEFLRLAFENPKHHEAHYKASLLQWQAGEIGAAKEHIESALAEEKNDPYYHFHHGVLLNHEKNYASANQAFEQCITIDPSIQEAHYNVAANYLLMQQPLRALPHYMYLLQTVCDPEVYYNIGVIYSQQDKHQDALHYLNQCVKMNPKHIAALNNIAATYLKLQQTSKAIDFYRKAHAADPNNPEYQFILDALQEKELKDPPQKFIQNLFDSYANHYDQHLTKYLKYTLPDQIKQTLSLLDGEKMFFNEALDLGCGTGLAAEALAGYFRWIDGVDLSKSMIKKAKEKHLYRELLATDCKQFLSQTDQKYQLILMIELLPYVSDPTHLVTLACQQLKHGGYLVLNHEACFDENWRMQKTLRYSHNAKFINKVLRENKLIIREQKNIVCRQQNNQPHTSVLWVAELNAAASSC